MSAWPPPSPTHIPGSHAVFNHLFGPIIADLIESNTKGARRGGSDSLVYSPSPAANDRLLFWWDDVEELFRLSSLRGRAIGAVVIVNMSLVSKQGKGKY